MHSVMRLLLLDIQPPTMHDDASFYSWPLQKLLLQNVQDLGNLAFTA